MEKQIHVEIIPPKQDSQKLEEDLQLFATKFERVMQSGFSASLTDNAMGLLAFQGNECIEELALNVRPGQVLIHLNTFHTKEELDKILNLCIQQGIDSVLAISGDGSTRLPKLKPSDLGITGTQAVTAVELIQYICKNYPQIKVGAAFNPYEPETHEFEKMKRKIDAGASFVITQPIMERNDMVDKLIADYPDIDVIIETWMSKKLYLLSDVVGYPIPEDVEYDPIATFEKLMNEYPDCGFYLSILGFKTQYQIVEDMLKNK